MRLTPEQEYKIRDPKGVWYGPHQCNGCGETVVVLSRQQGGLALNAPHNHNYPNHVWEEHVCGEGKTLKHQFATFKAGGGLDINTPLLC